MKHAQLLLIMTALLWSMGGILIKLVDWTPLAIAGGRSAFAAATIWLLLPPHRIRINRWVLAGAVAYSATVITFVTATKWTTAANAIFLQFTAPLYVALLGRWFLGENASNGDWFRIILAQIGIVLFFFDDLSWGSTAGNLVGLISGLCFACLVLLLRKQKDANPVDSVLVGNLLTVTVCLPFMIGPLPSAQSLLGVACLGIFQLGLSYYLYTRAIKYVRALPAILIGMIEPVLNPIWVAIFLHEAPGILPLIGGAIVIGAALLQGIASARRLETAIALL